MTEHMENKRGEVLLAHWNGFSIYENPDLARWWIQLKDTNGDIIASIKNVAEIHIAEAAPSLPGAPTSPEPDAVREAAIRAAVEKHCHCDTRWPTTARIDDSHMAAFVADLIAALSPSVGKSGGGS